MGGLPLKPKLQGYVQQELFDEFERFKATHNLNQSKALEKLLAEYFGKPSASTLPPNEVASALPLVAALRSELMELKLELTQRLQLLEDRLADSSADNSAMPLAGLADESAAPMISLSDESVTGFFSLVTDSASDSVDIQSGSAYKSVIPLDESAIESAVVEDAIALPATVSAISSADESASESVVDKPTEVETAIAGEPEEEEEAVVVEARAVAEKPHLTRAQLGEYLGGISRETIRQWEKSGKLAEEGWVSVPGTGTSPKKPRLYCPLPN